MYVSPKRFRETASRDGCQVTWEWATRDGRTGAVSINGTSYDPAAGRVFLISTRGGQVQVRQVPRDPSSVPAEQEGFLVLADSDPEIARFVAAAAEAARVPQR